MMAINFNTAGPILMKSCWVAQVDLRKVLGNEDCSENNVTNPRQPRLTLSPNSY